MITKQEFQQRLLDNIFYEDPEECINQRFPVIEYFCAHSGAKMMINNNVIDLSKIHVIRPDDNYNFTLMNQAFESLRIRLERGEL